MAITTLLRNLNIGVGSSAGWKSGSIPNGVTLIKLADALDCSVDYLLGRVDYPEIRQVDVDEDMSYHIKKDSPDLTAEEITKLKNFLNNLKK